MVEALTMEETRKKKVMVFIAETESSYYALVWVLNHLKEAIAGNKWSLLLFSAPPPTNFAVSSAPPLGSARLYFHGLAAPYWPSCDGLNRKISLGLLEKAKRICSSHGISAETIIVGTGGDPKIAICSAVEEHSVDLLIVGNEDDGTLKKRILMAMGGGNVGEYCWNNAKCPVLAVKKTVQVKRVERLGN